MTTDPLFDVQAKGAPAPAQATSVPAGSSGSAKFEKFRDAMSKDKALVRELEVALQVNVDRVNPSDPGNRFITGGAAEWIIAAAAWEANVLTVPGSEGFTRSTFT